jgi:hypothetical protein
MRRIEKPGLRWMAALGAVLTALALFMGGCSRPTKEPVANTATAELAAAEVARQEAIAAELAAAETARQEAIAAGSGGSGSARGDSGRAGGGRSGAARSNRGRAGGGRV